MSFFVPSRGIVLIDAVVRAVKLLESLGYRVIPPKKRKSSSKKKKVR